MTRSYASYRPSGVDWLGDVPSHWAAIQLRRTFDIVNGGTPPVSSEDCWDGDTAWLTPDDLGRNNRKFIGRGQRNITSEGIRTSSARLSPANSVLLSTRAPIGHLAITEVPAASNQGCRTLVPLGLAQSDFAYYALLASRDVLEAAGKGSTFMELSASDLAAHRLPSTPIDEQRSISAYLDRETVRIDKLVSMQASLIERLDEYRMALITRVVTKGLPSEAAEDAGLDPTPKLKDSGVEWLGDVPKHWEIVPLARVVLLQRGHDLPTDERELGPVPVVSSAGVSGQHIEAAATGPAIVTGRYGSIGEFYLIDGPFWPLNTTLYSIDTFGNDEKFLYFMLTSLKPLFLANADKSAVPGVDRNDLHAIRVAVPLRREQLAIAAYLESQLSRIDVLREKAQLSIERLLEYRSAVISAAVTGKIDVRDAEMAAAGAGA